MFDFNRNDFPPSARFFGRNFLEKVNHFFVPTTERFDDKWLKMNALGSATILVKFDGGEDEDGDDDEDEDGDDDEDDDQDRSVSSFCIIIPYHHSVSSIFC